MLRFEFECDLLINVEVVLTLSFTPVWPGVRGVRPPGGLPGILPARLSRTKPRNEVLYLSLEVASSYLSLA